MAVVLVSACLSVSMFSWMGACLCAAGMLDGSRDTRMGSNMFELFVGFAFSTIVVQLVGWCCDLMGLFCVGVWWPFWLGFYRWSIANGKEMPVPT